MHKVIRKVTKNKSYINVLSLESMIIIKNNDKDYSSRCYQWLECSKMKSNFKFDKQISMFRKLNLKYEDPLYDHLNNLKKNT